MRLKKIDEIELLNSEGPILKAKKTDSDEYVLYDNEDTIVNTLSSSQFTNFIYNNVPLTGTDGKQIYYGSYPQDTKTKKEDLEIFIKGAQTFVDFNEEDGSWISQVKCEKKWQESVLKEFNTDLFKESKSPYCPICEACGEDGCCPATICNQHPEGDYCEGYLMELKFTYCMYKDLMNLVADDPKYKDAVDKMWDENWDAIFKRDDEDNKIEDPIGTLFQRKLAKANETLERTGDSLNKIMKKNK